MSRKVYLSLVFHNHQPVGNFDFVFQEAYDKSYLPLVECLEKHPNIHVGIHITGPLRDWLMDHEPAFYDRLGELVDRQQIEIIGGAYYEPILVMLDDDDKIGQIEKLNQAIEDDFGVKPQGMWLAERVWEPSLPKPIAQSGLKYAIVDDTHFQFVGYKEHELYGYYITEDQGYGLAMLPSLKEMRYRLPWAEVDEVVDYLYSIHSDPTMPDTPLIFAGDDGEKFGLWPGTYERCWEQGYIDKLFTALENASEWLATVAPCEYIQKFAAAGRAYLPTASYLEMTEWSLPAEAAAELSEVRVSLTQEMSNAKADDLATSRRLLSVSRYLRGGFWRNFLVKYPEANHMQKRGLHISRRAHQMPEGKDKQKALAHLWAAQCNCAYWHGLFGGVYLFHIRAANYAHLLAAEALLVDDKIQVEKIDFDMDGQDELVITGRPFSMVIDLARGGSIIEWDDLPSSYNLLNIMTRRYEGYHARLQQAAEKGLIITPEMPDWNNPGVINSDSVRAKEAGLEHRLIVDQHRRGLLVEHFIGEDVTLEQFSRAAYHELGDFYKSPYTAEIKGSGSGSAVIVLSRDGYIERQPLHLEKRLKVKHDDRELEVEYTLTNTGTAPLKLRFGVEATFGFDGGDSDQCFFELEDPNGKEKKGHLGQTGAYQNVDEYLIGTKIRGFEMQIELDALAELWRFPLEPVTMSEAGFERIHQGAVFLHLFNIELEPGASWHTEFEFELESI